MAAQAIAVYHRVMNRSIISAALGALAIAAGSALALAPAYAQAQPKPDTEFCAKMRAQDPGGICTAKGEYVTPEKVYKPDGTVINRSTGD
ncbi:hypothetical protein [Sandarakinorhabdus limnophila]|jgi:hypothetical protein|uniref:hypothetical protein n=1 Tax=Sandarakinorhabdus limnophila TaxID=210512 RepID=UPI0026EA5147|nr:hypothetical protein [Sandarakinorhabdus limnophila]